MFYGVIMLNGDWIANGYYLGFACDYPTEDPEFFIEWKKGGQYPLVQCDSLGPATPGTNHNYIVYNTEAMGGSGWYAIRDGNCLKSWPDFLYDRGWVVAQSETHDSTNVMWNQYWDVQYCTSGLHWYSFNAPGTRADWPYTFEWVDYPGAF
jgi:hypothetical protein